MSTYAIGDIQGCYTELLALLKLIQFDPNRDQLWFAGDLINRGPDSLAVLRFIKSLTPAPIVTLGNHDLYFLAVASGAIPHRKNKDTFDDILQADDCEELCAWLRNQKLFHHDQGFTLVHAGIPPQWDLATSQRLAHEVEEVLQGDRAIEFFAHMHGNEPSLWDETLTGWKRLRLIINYLTRMRFCNEEGRLELYCKSTLGSQPQGYHPWFDIPSRLTQNDKILFGHWASLRGEVDVRNVYALDTGCVWGGKLSAFRLEDERFFSVACAREVF